MPKKPFPRKAVRAHVTWLSEYHDIEINWVRNYWDAQASVAGKLVEIPKPLDIEAYLVGLHEFGHVLSAPSRKLGRSKAFPDAMASEAYAWAWAIEHVIPEARAFASERTWTLLGKALASHLLYNDGTPWPDGWSS